MPLTRNGSVSIEALMNACCLRQSITSKVCLFWVGSNVNKGCFMLMYLFLNVNLLGAGVLPIQVRLKYILCCCASLKRLTSKQSGQGGYTARHSTRCISTPPEIAVFMATSICCVYHISRFPKAKTKLKFTSSSHQPSTLASSYLKAYRLKNAQEISWNQYIEHLFARCRGFGHEDDSNKHYGHWNLRHEDPFGYSIWRWCKTVPAVKGEHSKEPL